MKQGIYKYNDAKINFIKSSMKRVPFFANLDEILLYEIIFTLTSAEY